MRARRRNVVIIGAQLLALLLAAAAGCGDDAPAYATGERLVIPGTGACEELLRYVATRFNQLHPEFKVEIPQSSGSTGAIRAVAEGAAGLGRIARRIKPSEVELGLTYRPFAADAVVFAVGEDVSVTHLSSEQLAAIFSGEIDNWRQVGGDDAPIRVLYREESDSSLSVIRQCLPSFETLIFTSEGKCAYHDHEMIDLLHKYPTSIGFLTKSTSEAPGNRGRVLPLDGVPATLETVLSGQYPLVCEYALIYKEETLDTAARAFIRFVFSDAARRILLEHHVVPRPGD
jgi:phosphate transport system substrate-binding protein